MQGILKQIVQRVLVTGQPYMSVHTPLFICDTEVIAQCAVAEADGGVHNACC
jgi:hypothetical protein